jgi:hypothetical protein
MGTRSTGRTPKLISFTHLSLLIRIAPAFAVNVFASIGYILAKCSPGHSLCHKPGKQKRIRRAGK